jgi:glycerophosphoryl diester phosphodiesterase
MANWEAEMHDPLLNDLFSFVTSLDRSVPSEVFLVFSMPRTRSFELQGHRGARGLKPENTLPSFEAALDAGVSSIETDVRLSADGVPVLFHDDLLSDRLCRVAPGAPPGVDFHEEPYLSSFTLAELRGLLVDRNPDRRRFPRQTHELTPVAEMYAAGADLAPYAIPTVADLFAFTQAYAGSLGKKAGKSPAMQKRAHKVRFDLELKRVPYLPEAIGDNYSGLAAGSLEIKLVDTVRACKMVRRTTVRSFDHRAVRAARVLEPRFRGAVLFAGTTPVSPSAAARLARAEIYAPDYRFIDPEVVRQAHACRLTVIPWTVNEARDWEKLLAWGVDGITTDYPNDLADWLRKHHVTVK